MTHHFSIFATPLGDFSVAVDATGAVAATAFGGLAALRSRFEPDQLLADKTKATAAVREQVHAYFAGRRREFDLPLAPAGTAFQQRVWAALHKIPVGETRCYGDLAARLGSAPRAIGRANATNPVCLIVPCHRVIGADGSLTGFAFGEDLQHRLLAHEGALAAA
jgi:methylated-DNA-[protein]-cysteine S-methyltransferase